MCGLVGIAGGLEYKDEAIMKKLLVLDVFRGLDSTGIAVLRKTNEVKIAKIASHPLDLFDTKAFSNALTASLSTVLLGHNRAATKGAVNTVNAHPFQYDHIIGAHNGTLEQSSWKALEEMLGESTNVDSQAIFACIAKEGIEAVVPLLQGAWALTWIDLKEGTLNFLRNKERTFYYAYSEDFKKLYWASEWPMIHAALNLGGSSNPLFTDNKGNKFFATKENIWYRFDLGDLRAGYAERPKPMVKELKGKEPAPVTYVGNGSPFVHGMLPTQQSGMTQGNVTNLLGSSGGKREWPKQSGPSFQIPERKTIILTGTKNDPYAGYLQRKEFYDVARWGCSWCASTIPYDEVGVSIFEKSGAVLCPSCSPDPASNRVYTSSNHLFN